MDLSDEEIENYREAWRQDFKEELTHEQAESELKRILTFFQILYDSFYGPDRPDGPDDEDMVRLLELMK